MKTSVIEVRDMLSVLSVLGVEKRIGEVPSVESVTLNFAVASPTIRYDETRLNIADIKSDVRQSGHAFAAPAAAPAGDGHKGHSAPYVQPTTPASAVPKSAKDAAAATPAVAVPTGSRQRDNAGPGVPSTTVVDGVLKPSPGTTPTSAARRTSPDTAAAAPVSAVPDGVERQDKSAPGKS